ncbi:SAM-dependent methyltransferase [Hyphococcus luteus]|uniref:SAM-dependent methyltransferase n=1 Tax=Hyphococcus luteus TaxID=2058213 RepID=A0A2S7K2K3_9PROT|nr:class I SAM-dependent methyltransferase [Marinicaulis flavus]PQA86730.1 SAM-dependent methyltransferase [Marinicaulis flavus]
MWNERYAAPGYLFGTEPAAFLKNNANYLTPGARALAVADGEGRNSVFLAENGLEVTAMDSSEVALEKARDLASGRGVDVDFRLADIMAWDWTPEAYDVVVAIFIQFAPPAERAKVFEGVKQTLKPGGLILLHGYRPEQVDYGTGGPPQRENMYTEDLLHDAFGDMEILRLEAYDREIEEGEGHAGMSALIDLIARKQ